MMGHEMKIWRFWIYHALIQEENYMLQKSTKKYYCHISASELVASVPRSKAAAIYNSDVYKLQHTNISVLDTQFSPPPPNGYQ